MKFTSAFLASFIMMAVEAQVSQEQRKLRGSSPSSQTASRELQQKGTLTIVNNCNGYISVFEARHSGEYSDEWTSYRRSRISDGESLTIPSVDARFVVQYAAVTQKRDGSWYEVAEPTETYGNSVGFTEYINGRSIPRFFPLYVQSIDTSSWTMYLCPSKPHTTTTSATTTTTTTTTTPTTSSNHHNSYEQAMNRALESCPQHEPNCQEWLTEHNTRRWTFHSEHGAETPSLLEWDEQLASDAQAWANKYMENVGDADLCQYFSDDSVTDQGQLIWTNKGSKVDTPERIMAFTWDVQYQRTQRDNFRSIDSVAEFTQAAWFSTTRIGCGLLIVDDMQSNSSCHVQVCRYAGRGNCNIRTETWESDVMNGPVCL